MRGGALEYKIITKNINFQLTVTWPRSTVDYGCGFFGMLLRQPSHDFEDERNPALSERSLFPTFAACRRHQSCRFSLVKYGTQRLLDKAF
ncbi:hypothetical protein Cob_v012078 [Colletotrichum orbiculare MAFF 240422]|uniref:Uncharacterized protein n=1 Tax=Colletotrichum orbiculare (strain 104-T / ATCC 96160 / CBS 514.97 / LARS 414 / MAFF 240422) TaxID=1213857 RepID=A0A484FAL5_COLOR|nr:hypothetical protein Cob_v012078 [Colletotrichum orbiculare MAFF 240422]